MISKDTPVSHEKKQKKKKHDEHYSICLISYNGHCKTLCTFIRLDDLFKDNWAHWRISLANLMVVDIGILGNQWITKLFTSEATGA